MRITLVATAQDIYAFAERAWAAQRNLPESR